LIVYVRKSFSYSPIDLTNSAYASFINLGSKL
jgi:hypothetical protein